MWIELDQIILEGIVEASGGQKTSFGYKRNLGFCSH